MAYTINLGGANPGTIFINDNDLNNDYAIPLLGRNRTNYGQPVALAFTRLLSNFANASAPTGIPLIGQLWYDSNAQELKVYNPANPLADGDGYASVSPTATLAGLTDTAIGVPTTGQVLRWDGTAWANGASSFQELSNTPGTLNANQFLRVNAAGTGITQVANIPSGVVSGLAAVATSGNYSDLSGTPTVPSVINDLSNVNATPSVNQVLGWDGSNWVAQTVASATFTAGNGIQLVGSEFRVLGGTGLTQETNGLALTLINGGAGTTGALTYNGTTSAAGRLYGGSTNPTNTSNRVNYNGPFHATTLTSHGQLSVTTGGAVVTGNSTFNNNLMVNASSNLVAGGATINRTEDPGPNNVLNFNVSASVNSEGGRIVLAANGAGNRLLVAERNIENVTPLGGPATVRLYGGNPGDEVARTRSAATGAFEVAPYAGSNRVVGFREVQFRGTSSSTSLQLADSQSTVLKTTGSAISLTIPTNATVALPIGTTIAVINGTGSGNFAITRASGVILRWIGAAPPATPGENDDRTVTPYGIATLYKRSTTEWFIWGIGIE